MQMIEYGNLTFPVTPATAKVFNYLKERGSITNLEAHVTIHARSVSRRITELIEEGVNIRKERRRDVNGQPYVRYFLEPPLARAA